MIGSDLQSKVGVDMDQAHREIRQLRQEFAALGVEIRKTNAAGRDMQRSLQVPKNNDRSAQKGFAAAGKVGGKVGAQFGVLSASESMGAFGRVAIAAAGAAALIQTGTAIIGKITEDTRDVATRRLAVEKDILSTAQKIQDQALAAALSGTEARANLVAVGGEGAIGMRDRLVKAGVGTQQEVTQGLTTILGQLGTGLRAGDTIDAAVRAQGAGVPFAQAATELAPMGRALGDPATAEVIVGRLVKKHMGRVLGDPVQFLRQIEGRIAADPVVAAGRQASALNAQAGLVGETRIVTDAEAAGRRALATAVDPAAAAATARHLEDARAIQVLTEIRDEFRRRRDDKTFLSHPISNVILRLGEMIADQKLLKETRTQGQSMQKRP